MDFMNLTTKRVTRIVMLLLMSLCLYCISASAAAGQRDAGVSKADRLVTQGRFEEAVDALEPLEETVSKSDPVQFHLDRGKEAQKAQDYEKAIEEYDAAVAFSGGDSCVRAERALFYESIGQTGVALADIELALAGGCDSPRALALRGRLYLSEGDVISGVETISQVLNDPAERPRALNLMGIAFMWAGFPETAIQYLMEAEQLMPDDGGLALQIADCLSLLGRFEESLEYYKRSIKIEPKNEVANNNYGYSLFMMGRTDEALALFIRQNKENPNIYSLCNTMEISLHNEDYKTAAIYGRLCLASFDDGIDNAYDERYYMGAAAQAMKFLGEDRLALHPKTQLDLANRHIEKGELADALASALIALMLDPIDTDAIFEAGRLYALLGDSGKADTFLNLVIHLGGPSAPNTMEARRILFMQAFNTIDSSIADQRWF
jgi:tetratricopeptide (TPR) repeat protein